MPQIDYAPFFRDKEKAQENEWRIMRFFALIGMGATLLFIMRGTLWLMHLVGYVMEWGIYNG
jgi:hypothetical protein